MVLSVFFEMYTLRHYGGMHPVITLMSLFKGSPIMPIIRLSWFFACCIRIHQAICFMAWNVTLLSPSKVCSVI